MDYAGRMYGMDTVTINVTMPRQLMNLVRREVKVGLYTSVSELLREGARRVVTRKGELTINGFTSEFEEEVLEAAAEPVDESDVWDGKGSFVQWALADRRKPNGKG